MENAIALKEWLQREGRKIKWLAAQLGIRQGTVTQWLHGKNTPHPVHRARIEELTLGDVPADGWGTQ